MTTAALTPDSARTLAREVGLAVGLAGLTALAAKVAIPLPGTPVPATLQTAAVIFAGAAFGARRGLISQGLYLLVGLLGLPVFAPWTPAGPAALAGPTAGFLVAFPLVAWLAGRGLATRTRWLMGAAALACLYLVGAGWLTVWALATGAPVSAAWVLLAGVVPFLPFDLLKAGLALLSAGPIRRRVDRLGAR